MYDVSAYLSRIYPDKEFVKTAQFIYLPGNLQLSGIPLYEGKETQYLIYGSKNDGRTQLYIIDIKENTLQRYIGDNKVYEAFDILSRDTRPLPTDTPEPVDPEAYRTKYAFSEFVDRAIGFYAEHPLFIAVTAVVIIVIPLMIVGICVTAHEKKAKKNKEDES